MVASVTDSLSIKHRIQVRFYVVTYLSDTTVHRAYNYYYRAKARDESGIEHRLEGLEVETSQEVEYQHT